jgi:predicted RNase H-like HicB family nuclease
MNCGGNVMRQVIIHRADPDETGFWAEVPSLPGCFSQGETIEETLENIKDAIQGYIASLERRGLPVPKEALRKDN